MIDLAEIRDAAATLDVSEANLQRDYVFGWLLAGIYGESPLGSALVLKGGNALRKAYFPASRFSEDLDFSVSVRLEGERLLAELNDVCRHSGEKSGIDFDLDRNRVVDTHMIDAQRQAFKIGLYFKDMKGTEVVDDGPDAHPGNDYAYDAAGRLRTAHRQGKTYSYSFASSGGCGSLAAAGKNTNRTSMVVDSAQPITYCYDKADRLSATSDSRYSAISYDSRSNTTLLGNEAMAYDGSSRHVATTKGSTQVLYVRDATGRIVERRVNGLTVARYGFSSGSDSPAFVQNAAGQVIERNVALIGGAMLTKRSSGDVWSYPDVSGHVVAVANAAGIKQGTSNSYDPYGATNDAPDNAAGDFDFGWLGNHMRGLEAEAGIATIEMGARPYVPGLGRFVQADSVEGGSANDFDYVAGDPINSADLTGRFIGGDSFLGLLGLMNAMLGDCRERRSASMAQYLTGAACPPKGFTAAFYLPLRISTTAGWRMADPYGSCSDGPVVDGTGPFWDFQAACKVHDYGYDLLRFLKVGGRQRVAVDRMFTKDLNAHCGTRFILIRGGCNKAASIYSRVVSTATLVVNLFGSGIPR